MSELHPVMAVALPIIIGGFGMLIFGFFVARSHPGGGGK